MERGEHREVGLFGGSFNPVHTSHVALARQLLEAAGLDEVWFMVSPQNPLKRQADLLDDSLRLEMVREALREEPRMKACDDEFALPRPSYTWNTLQALGQRYPLCRFTLLVGGDNWAAFSRWYRYRDILDHYRVAVYPRPGSVIGEAALPASVMLVKARLMDISSTEIRRRIAAGLPVSGWLDPGVERIVRERNLYAFSPKAT